MRYKFKIVFFLIFSFSFTNANATGQYPDNIIIEGKEYYTINNPLEPFFEKFPERKPKSNISSSALHRGYIAKFTLIDKKLYLIDIKIYVSNKDSLESGEMELISVFNKVFPDEDKVLMDLYSGVLVVVLNIESSFWDRNRLLIEFQNGKELERRIYNNEKYQKFIDEQFELYKKTEEYKIQFRELMDVKEDDFFKSKQQREKFAESLIRKYTPNFTSKFVD